MKAVIYHNPNCGTSRKTLEILNEAGADVSIVEYLKTPPSKEELRRLYDRAGIKPSEGLRAKEQLGLQHPACRGLDPPATARWKVSVRIAVQDRGGFWCLCRYPTPISIAATTRARASSSVG